MRMRDLLYSDRFSTFVSSLFVLGGATIVGFLSAGPSNQSLLLILIIGFGVAIVIFRHRLAMETAIFCLPFMQAPTLKWLLRWQISEVIAWIYLTPHIVSLLNWKRNKIPSASRSVLYGMIGYFLYTGLIGLAHFPFIEILVQEALEYAIHPFFRLALETARGFASVSLLIGLLITVRTYEEFHRIMKLLAWSGAVGGSYGIYQAAVLGLGLPLPLLPGTLFHEGYARPFGTFYEPTGLGSFTAVTTLLSLYFIMERSGLPSLICFTANMTGLVVSMGRAGYAGFVIGVITLVLISLGSRRAQRLIIPSLIVITGVIWLSYSLAIALIGESVVKMHLSLYWLMSEESLPLRVDTYLYFVPRFITDFFYGYGQGLFIFYGAGIAGFGRLLVEGGFIGTMFLALLHIGSIRCLFQLRASSGQVRAFLPFLWAMYLSSIVTTLNYINTTEMWIWFIWSLPAIALRIARQTE